MMTRKEGGKVRFDIDQDDLIAAIADFENMKTFLAEKNADKQLIKDVDTAIEVMYAFGCEHFEEYADEA